MLRQEAAGERAGDDLDAGPGDVLERAVGHLDDRGRTVDQDRIGGVLEAAAVDDHRMPVGIHEFDRCFDGCGWTAQLQATIETTLDDGEQRTVDHSEVEGDVVDEEADLFKVVARDQPAAGDGLGEAGQAQAIAVAVGAVDDLARLVGPDVAEASVADEQALAVEGEVAAMVATGRRVGVTADLDVEWIAQDVLDGGLAVGALDQGAEAGRDAVLDQHVLVVALEEDPIGLDLATKDLQVQPGAQEDGVPLQEDRVDLDQSGLFPVGRRGGDGDLGRDQPVDVGGDVGDQIVAGVYEVQGQGLVGRDDAQVQVAEVLRQGDADVGGVAGPVDLDGQDHG
jgi:hypothetical protein